MAVTEFESAAEVQAHRSSFMSFERLVLFAVMHVTLTLGCLALAFLGHLPVIGLLLGLGGTLALIVGFMVGGANSAR
jgi:hypothetical protein